MTERAELIDLARDGLAEHRLARRANALVLLDRGMSCAEIGAVLFLDDDTVRTWFRLYRESGTGGLAGFGYEGSDGHLNARQREELKSWPCLLCNATGEKLVNYFRILTYLLNLNSSRVSVSQPRFWSRAGAEAGVPADGSGRPAPTAAPGVRQRMVLAGLGRAERTWTSLGEP